ncbi:phage integrase [Providencia manganoxydans]|uniref:phage integrase n=1 Tax=Providencia manganoxydans TaxID=2923283 RepID=UPI0034E4D19D
MPIKKLDDGRYIVDIRPTGRNGKRIRRTFSKKTEAIAFERYTLSHAGKIGKDIDRRTLNDLLELWWMYHGITLKNAEIEHRQLTNTIADLGNPQLSRFNKLTLLNYRSARLMKGIAAATINRDLYRLSGMLSALSKLEFFCGENPINGLPSLKENRAEMTFLSHDEIKKLLHHLTGDYKLVALLCISTGARWDEAATLRGEQVINGRVTFLETKNGKTRTVPISTELQELIKTKPTGRLFDVVYNTFRYQIKKVKTDLPRGQATHVLRHTFASHFMMNGGNIVALQEILGHASIQQTMIYAHLSPDYMQFAITLNPLRGGVSL